MDMAQSRRGTPGKDTLQDSKLCDADGDASAEAEGTRSTTTAMRPEKVQPPRLSFLELALCVAGWFGSVSYTIYCVYNVSQGNFTILRQLMNYIIIYSSI